MSRVLSRILRRIVNAWLWRLTGPGRFIVVAALFALSAGCVTLTVPIYHLACGLAGLLGGSALSALLTRRRLRIQGELPDKVTTGQPFTTAFTLENPSRLAAYDVGLGMFHLPRPLKLLRWEPTVPRLGPGESVSIPITIEARKRGLHKLPKLCAFSTFPFNILRKPVADLEAGALLVLPAFEPIAGLDVPVARRYQPGGVALTSNVGESPEYIGNRDYRPGDAARRIDFRSWARLAKPVVREYMEEYYCRIALVLDTFIPPRRRAGAEGFAELEAAVSLCAAVAESVSRGDHLIDLFAAGPQLYVFRAGRHVAHFDNILEILACVEACRRSPFETLSPVLADELQRITAVIYILLDWDRAREQFVRAAAGIGTATRVFIVRDGDTTEPYAPAEEWAGPIAVLAPDDVRTGGAPLR